MKIVFFTTSTLNYGGGCEKNFMNLGFWMKGRGHQVSYVTATSRLNEAYCKIAHQGEHEKNFSDETLKKEFGVEKYIQFRFVDIFFHTRRRSELMDLLRESDAVVSKNEIFEVLLLRYLLKGDLKKVNFGFHTPIYYPLARGTKAVLHNLLYTSWLYFWLLGDANLRLLSDVGAENPKLRKYLSKHKTFIIPNPLNTDAYSTRAFFHRDEFHVYYIGRMTEQKGVDVLAQAIKIILNNKDYNKIQFVFVGNGVEEERLKSLAKTDCDRCVFFGFQKNVLSYYHDADLVVVPSRVESFCYSVAEAQSCGIPVIASDIPGPNNIIIPEKTGWLIKPEDSDILAESIVAAYRMWSSALPTYIEKGLQARANIIARFSEEKINESTEKMLTFKA